MNGFLTDKFANAKFEPRTEEIDVPFMRDFFEEGREPKFIIRGLNAVELNTTIEANTKQKSIDNIVKAITTDRDQIQSVRKALGMSGDIPAEIAKRIETFVLGCVSPQFNHSMAVKFAEAFPIEFYDITNKILNLTGMGGSYVKPQPSSQTTTA